MGTTLYNSTRLYTTFYETCQNYNSLLTKTSTHLYTTYEPLQHLQNYSKLYTTIQTCAPLYKIVQQTLQNCTNMCTNSYKIEQNLTSIHNLTKTVQHFTQPYTTFAQFYTTFTQQTFCNTLQSHFCISFPQHSQNIVHNFTKLHTKLDKHNTCTQLYIVYKNLPQLSNTTCTTLVQHFTKDFYQTLQTKFYNSFQQKCTQLKHNSTKTLHNFTKLHKTSQKLVQTLQIITKYC